MSVSSPACVSSRMIRSRASPWRIALLSREIVLDWYRTGEAALDAVRSRRYSAVISDVSLPDIPGDWVFKKVSEQATFVPANLTKCPIDYQVP